MYRTGKDTKCRCRQKHDEIISEFYSADDDLLNYQEFERNIKFLIVKEALIIVDCKENNKCPRCKLERSLYIYGDWPDVRASFGDATDLPIRAPIHGIKEFVEATEIIYDCNIGTFIYAHLWRKNDGFKVILRTPQVEIEHDTNGWFQNISVDEKPAICCRTYNNKFIIINSDGKKLHTEFYLVDKYTDSVKLQNGKIEYVYSDSTWEYKANPALKTKPAARE
jgi:hypothetical protein